MQAMTETLLIIGAAALAAAVAALGTLWWMRPPKPPPPPREPEVMLDWRPTLRMDARADAAIEESDDDMIPANWVCRTQEIRLVSSVSSTPHAEVRWRQSTRREVRDLFSTYHKAMEEEITKRAKTLRAPELESET